MLRPYIVPNSSASRSSTCEFGTAVAPASRAVRSRSARTCEPLARTGVPRATSLVMRSVDPAGSISSTASSHAASSRVTSAPAATTTRASFERNTRSRVARNTCLGIERRHPRHHLDGGRMTPQQVPEPLRRLHDHHGVARWGVPQAVQDQEQRRGQLDRRDGHLIGTTVPGNLDLFAARARVVQEQEEIVVDLPDFVLHAFPRPIEQRVEGLTLVAFEVLLRRPVVGLEAGDIRAPLAVVSQLVGERLPRLRAPVETPEACERGERAVIENDARL